MPELPDIEAYCAALETRLVGTSLASVRLGSPFLLRSVNPPLTAASNRSVGGVKRLGKRIVFGLENDLFLVLHLMIAGRLKWFDLSDTLPSIGGRNSLASFDFSSGSLLLTEASKKKRASLHLIEGEENLATHNPGGLEILDSTLGQFRDRLLSTNHTLKRSLTDPRLFSGIGNAYSDEILHAAELSPIVWTSRLSEEDLDRLFTAAVSTLSIWRDRLVAEAIETFPKKVTAFRPEMAAHGKFGQPCPRCDHPIQRIVYAANETNYCAHCQTKGKILADRALSRLLKDDWPRTLEELEANHDQT